MKQKTAMQEAISHLSIWVDSGLSVEKWIENYTDKLLEKEKEQIMKAHQEGYRNGCAISEEYNTNYYNSTYKQD